MGAQTLSLIVAGSAVGGLVSLAMTVTSWNDRDHPAAAQFGWLTLAVAGWCFFAAGQLSASTTGEAYLFERLVRLTSTHVAPLALTFILTYAGHDEWLKPRYLAVLWTVPVLYSVASITAPVHGLATGPAAVTFQTVAGVTAPVVPIGPVKALHVTFAYVVMLLAYAVVFDLLIRTRTAHRGQTAAVVVGSLLPFLGNAAFYMGRTPHPGIDPTPLTFVLCGGVIGLALYRYDFLTVTPVASDVLVAELPDPVLVLDQDDVVVDHNPAAATALGADGTDIDGADLAALAPGLPRLLSDGGVYSRSVEYSTDETETRFYDPHVATLDDQHDMTRGRLVVLRDVTGQQRRQDRLEALQAATQRFISAHTDEEIAGLAVDFVEQALERHSAGVFLRNDDGTALWPASVTDAATEFYDEDELVLGPETAAFDAYESSERRTVDPKDGSPFDEFRYFPLGDHGVLAVGSRSDAALASDDEQFAAILARTTQVALSQVEREHDLRRSRAAVERRSEQIEFFNGVLRHTLRNALLVIQGRSDHLRGQVDATDEPHLDVIERWCNDLAALSDEIRAINDTVTATESERFEAVDLSALLAAQVDAIESEYRDVDISVTADAGLSVRANELAGRVLDTVVRNAVEHNDSAVSRVAITTRHVADRIQVRVADNGPGMSEELKESVFERKLGTSETASGFGLYFVSVVMNLYGGTIWFEDNDPTGTVAVLEFQTPKEDE